MKFQGSSSSRAEVSSASSLTRSGDTKAIGATRMIVPQPLELLRANSPKALAERSADRQVLAATLTAIVHGHKQSQIDDLLPWNYAPEV